MHYSHSHRCRGGNPNYGNGRQDRNQQVSIWIMCFRLPRSGTPPTTLP